MKISVILPCFNGAQTISEQLDSLIQQRWDEGWELVFVDNGSTDDSATIVESYRDRLPELRIVSAHEPGTPHRGAYHSYNTGFRHATGDAFVLCEADDRAGDGWLEAMGQALRQHPFICGRLEHNRLNPWLDVRRFPQLQEQGLQDLSRKEPRWWIAWGCTFGIRRDAFEFLGHFAEDFGAAGDAEYCLRAQRLGLVPVFVKDAVMHYRLRAAPSGALRQQMGWGRDLHLLCRAYFIPVGKLQRYRQVGRVARLLLIGCLLLPLIKLFPAALKSYHQQWYSKMGWNLGRLHGLFQPVPFYPTADLSLYGPERRWPGSSATVNQRAASSTADAARYALTNDHAG